MEAAETQAVLPWLFQEGFDGKISCQSELCEIIRVSSVCRRRKKRCRGMHSSVFSISYFDSARAFSKVSLMLSDGSLSMRLTTMIAMTEKRKPGTSS